jgi:hypothetical protein
VHLPPNEAAVYERRVGEAFTDKFREELRAKSLSARALERPVDENNADTLALQVWSAVFQMALEPRDGVIKALDDADYPELNRVGTQLLAHLNERAEVLELFKYSETAADILRGEVRASNRNRDLLAERITSPATPGFAERAISAAIAEPVNLSALLVETVGYYAQVFAPAE